jgi:ankyrin repeat protein
VTGHDGTAPGSAELERRMSNGHTVVTRDGVNGGGNGTALVVASCNGHLEVVRKLLKHENVNANAKDKRGFTAFLWAGYKGHWEVVREFLKYGHVDVNVKGPLGNTVIFWATLCQQLDVVVDVTILNDAGSTVLDIACKCELLDIARLLEEHV